MGTPAGRDGTPGVGAPSLLPPGTLDSVRTSSHSKYRLLARLGRGGMAEVYLAVTGHGPGGFNKLLVLKLLRPDLPPREHADFVRMFGDEGRLATRLNHPNIVQAYEVGSEGELSYIAMEYLEGQALSAIQDRGWHAARGISLELQLQVLCQALEGLEYAHGLADYDGRRLGIVHRDVSPQNIFVTYSGHTKLVDFGIAKTLESKAKTAAGVVKGKVCYMSPEQLRSDKVDHRADLFSVGVMLWEAIARCRMHGDAEIYEVINRVVKGDLPRLRDAVPDVDRRLEQIVARALFVEPERRYPDAGALRDDLLAFLDGHRKLSSRELGEPVARLFAVEREAIGEVIRAALRDVGGEGITAPVGASRAWGQLPWVSVDGTQTSESAAQTVAIAPPEKALVDPAIGPTAIGPVSEPPSDARVQRATTAPTSTSETSAQKHWSRLGLIGGIGTIAVLAVVAVRVPRTAAPNDELPRLIRIELRAEPSSARFALDGQRLDGNPYRAERAPDSLPHVLEVTADAHDARRIEVMLTRDLDLQVYLAGSLPPPPAPGTSEAPIEPDAPIPAASLHGSPADLGKEAPPTRGEAEKSRSAPSDDDVYPDRLLRPRPLDTSDAPYR